VRGRDVARCRTLEEEDISWAMMMWLACADLLERVLDREGDPARGAQVFAQHCASCHGADASGGEGPDLRDDDDTREELADKILWGWGAMEGFEGVLSVREVADVVAFVQQEVQQAPSSPSSSGSQP
jgi:mono/diheme cytochrome c family protein